MEEKKNYYPYLDGMRAVAALYVVFMHILTQFKFEGLYDFPLLKKYSVIFFSNGVLSVDFFIVISGFCLTIPMINANEFRMRGGALNFYKKRLKRIYIPYFFATLFSLMLIYTLIGVKMGTHWDMSIPVTMTDIARHIFLIHDIFYSSYAKINHAFWSISVECRIYLFFPLMLWLWRRYGPAYTLIASVGISAILFIASQIMNNYIGDITTNIEGVNPYLVLFVLGMLGCEIALGNKRYFVWLRNKLHWEALIVIIGAAVLILQRIALHSTFMYWFEIIDVLVGCWAVCVLVAASERRLYFDKVFSYRPLVFIGTFAYSIYLIHAPLIQVVWQYVINPMHLNDYSAYCLLVLLGLPFILAMSYLFYLAFERPFMNHKKPLIINDERLKTIQTELYK